MSTFVGGQNHRIVGTKMTYADVFAVQIPMAQQMIGEMLRFPGIFLVQNQAENLACKHDPIKDLFWQIEDGKRCMQNSVLDVDVNFSRATKNRIKHSV